MFRMFIKNEKGVSPLIATVLLIAFTIAVAGVVSLWLTGFASESTETIEGESKKELTCSYGAISVTNLKYCNSYLSGIVENSGLITLGNVTIQVVFQNATPAQTIYLAQNGSNLTAGSEMYIKPTSLTVFNVSIAGSNYNRIHVYTNCSNAYDDVDRAYVTQTC